MNCPDVRSLICIPQYDKSLKPTGWYKVTITFTYFEFKESRRLCNSTYNFSISRRHTATIHSCPYDISKEAAREPQLSNRSDFYGIRIWRFRWLRRISWLWRIRLRRRFCFNSRIVYSPYHRRSSIRILIESTFDAHPSDVLFV